MSNAFLPDEVWHTQRMSESATWPYIAVDNYQAHGPAFWYFGARIFDFFGSIYALYVLRLLSLLSLIGAGMVCVYCYIAKNPHQKQVINPILFSIFIFSTPFFWWGGKLIIVEFFQCLLIALSFYFIIVLERWRVLSFFLLGICFGLKFHVGAAIAFFFANQFLFLKRKVYLLSLGASFLLGFITSSPFLVVNFKSYLSNIQGNGRYFTGTELGAHWLNILWGRYAEWDMTYFGGLHPVIMNLIVAMVILVTFFILFLKEKNLISFIVFIFSSILMYSANSRFLAIYLFPFATMLLLFASQSSLHLKKEFLSKILGIGIVLNLFTTAPQALHDNKIRKWLVENLKVGKEHTNCIANSVLKSEFGSFLFIVNNTDLGKNAEGISFFDSSQFLSKVGHKFESKNPPIFQSRGDEIIVTTEIFKKLFYEKKHFLFLEGERAKHFTRYSNFRYYFDDLVANPELKTGIPNMGLKSEFRKIGFCNGTQVYAVNLSKEKNDGND